MNRSRNVFGDVAVYGLVVAGIFVMTKNANGSRLVSAFTNGYANIARAVTGQ